MSRSPEIGKFSILTQKFGSTPVLAPKIMKNSPITSLWSVLSIHIHKYKILWVESPEKKVWNLASHHAWRTQTQERAAQSQHIWAPKSAQTLPWSIRIPQLYNSTLISSFDACPKEVIQKFINRSWRIVDSYRKGLTGEAVVWVVKKQKGHQAMSKKAMKALEERSKLQKRSQIRGARSL